jgi:long-subunit fatty acid transport protein
MLVMAVSWLASGTAHASPLQLFGLGPSSPGRAGTGAADSVGFESVYVNPAGLADAPGKRITLAAVHGEMELDGVPRAIDTISGVELGGAMNLPLGGWWKDRVGLGFGFHVPSARLNKARAPAPGTPYYALLESRAETVGIQVGLGLRLHPDWSVGFAILTLAALEGQIHVRAEPDGRFSTTSEQQLLSHYAPIAGARWRHHAFAVGLVLRGASRSAYDIEVTSDLGTAIPLTLPELRFAGVSQYDPLTALLEGAWRHDRLLLSAQLAYERWSAFPRPTQNPVAGMPETTPAPDFDDTFVPRAGVEWRHTWLTVRGGYAFLYSPAPADRALVDNHRHVVAVGAGATWAPFHLDAFLQWHALVDRDDTGGDILVGGLGLGVEL